MDFKDRNLLTKLNIGLNLIDLTADQVQSASSEDLQKVAAKAEEVKKNRKYDIKIPDITEEFPSQGKKASKVYPLPISNENQCTILGVASNLDIFTDEFGFKIVNNKKLSVPITRISKNYDLEMAYKRYAFLQSYKRHKETQKEYDSILSGQEMNECNEVESEEGFDQTVTRFEASDSSEDDNSD